MIGWLRRLFQSPPPKPSAPALIFKSNEAFFDIECLYGRTEIVKGQHIVALVVDAREHAGTSRAIKREADGSQLAMIRIASAEGGWMTVATTASGGRAQLAVGDLVAWLPMSQLSEPLTHDPRSVWVGLIIARLAPELSDGQIKVIDRY